MIKILLVMVVINGVFAYGKEKRVEFLDIVEPGQKVFLKNNVEIKRKLTRCAKNRGHLFPLIPISGVTPITEIDILNSLGGKDVLLVDMRKELQYLEETIPTAINVPYTDIEKNMDKVGCIWTDGSWDCSEVKKVYAFCNGPVCSQSPTAMQKMIDNGFPVERLYYYRGGMFAWDGLGLTTVMGE